MIDNGNMTVEQRIRQFDIKNGNDSIPIDGWHVYSNGAKRQYAALGALLDPPTNIHERTKIIIMYNEKKLELAVNKFNQLKNELLLRAKANLQERTMTPPAPCETELAMQKLKTLKAEILKAQEKLETARSQLDSSQPAWLVAKEARCLANKEKNEQFIAAISSIDV